ncbi:MAG: class II fructose-bisphosphate aldolase, partial [Pseudomonadota bacterium]
CHAALDAGFTSVMYDGSQLSLADNIQETGKMIALAERYGASTEAEIGYVGYADGAASEGTDPSEAAQFYADAPTDCLAVSAGNVHLQTEQAARLDFDRLGVLNTQVPCPLVLHGGSGVAEADRRRAARAYRVRKINLGTELRQVHGRALRQVLAAKPDIFDRIQIQTPVSAAIEAAARDVLTLAWEAAS